MSVCRYAANVNQVLTIGVSFARNPLVSRFLPVDLSSAEKYVKFWNYLIRCIYIFFTEQREPLSF